jgi:hypothetical protein
MKYVEDFKKGFVGSILLAAAIVTAIYSTMVSFVKHEGNFSFRNTQNHH